MNVSPSHCEAKPRQSDILPSDAGHLASCLSGEKMLAHRTSMTPHARRPTAVCRIATLALAMTVGGLLLTSCKSPFERTKDASGAGGTGAVTGSARFPVFSNELKTGGGAFLYPGAENQALSFNDTSNAVGARAIRYAWNGGDVSAPGCTPNPQAVFAGFDLMHTPLQSSYDSTPGRNLGTAGYGKVNFFARGTLGANTVIKIEVASPGVGGGCPVPPHVPCITLSANGTDDPGPYSCGKTGTLSGSWNSFSTSGIAPSDLASVKDFFKATYLYTGTGNGSGGTVYFDQIEYVP